MKRLEHRNSRPGGLPKAFRHNGITYDLDHLRPFFTTFVRPAQDRLSAVTFNVDVSFSDHCFTRGLPDEGAYDETSVYSGESEVRLFDARRWALSKGLAALIEELPTRECQFTGGQNFLTVALAGEDGTTVEYEVFFRVRKTRPGRLWLLVESAYVREPKYRASRPKGRRVRFLVILYNVLNDKPLKS